MQIRKSIAYSFPTSINAEALGFGKEGCYHVSLQYLNVDGSGMCRILLPHDAKGFAKADDPDLIALFHSYEGDICQHFLTYGNADALNAIKRD